MNRSSLLALLFVTLTTGCASGPLSNLPGSGLFAGPERTSYQTPGKRVEQAWAAAARSTGQDTPDQQAIVSELARQVQTEQDPLVREAIMQSIARFRPALSTQVLTAGLSDSDAGVRMRCCQMLGERGEASSIGSLQQVMKNDNEFDVRVAATQALGQIKTPEATQALVAALEDRDPAMQFAGVQAMRNSTGRDLGNDVNAYLAVARGETPPVSAGQPEVSVAGRLRNLSPF